MAEDIRLAKGEDVDAIKAEMALKANTADLEKDGYLKKKIVGALPSRQIVYDFENDKPIFTVPKISSTVKGLSEIITSTDGSKYHRICSTGAAGASTTIGSSSIVYSEFDLSSLTANSDNVIMEFDFMFEHNGRMRVSIGDLDILRTLTGATKYETAGIAADIFSTAGNVFQINGMGLAHESYFSTWLHCRFEFDLSAKMIKYSMVAKDNTADSLSGTVNFRGSCDKITGIALYTWLANDTVCFDNIEITSKIGEGIDDRTIYIILENGAFLEYIYIDGKPVLIGRSDIVELMSEMVRNIYDIKADKQTITGGFVAGRNAEVATVEGTPLKYFYIGQWKNNTKLSYISGNPQALYDGNNTGTPVNSVAQVFNVFDLGEEMNISSITLYVSDKGANTTNMVRLSSELPIAGLGHEGVLRTNGAIQSGVPIIENKLSSDGYIKVGFTNGKYIGKYRYIMVFDWSNTCTASEIYAETDTAETPIPAIQLGEGKNESPHTLQVYNYQLMDKNGKIPIDRLPTEFAALLASVQSTNIAEAETTVDIAYD